MDLATQMSCLNLCSLIMPKSVFIDNAQVYSISNWKYLWWAAGYRNTGLRNAAVKELTSYMVIPNITVSLQCNFCLPALGTISACPLVLEKFHPINDLLIFSYQRLYETSDLKGKCIFFCSHILSPGFLVPKTHACVYSLTLNHSEFKFCPCAWDCG